MSVNKETQIERGNQECSSNSILTEVEQILSDEKYEPSDFMASFVLVRCMLDYRADYAALKAELDCSQKAFSTERREHEDTLADLEKAREALTSIASGMGRDILGATSLSREDMQSIAKQALEG